MIFKAACFVIILTTKSFINFKRWVKIIVAWKNVSRSLQLTQRFWTNVPPNGHTTSNRRQFDVDITSIHRRPNYDEFPRWFHLLFLCNFGDQKIHVVSTYIFWCNFNSRKIYVVSTYFFRRNFDGRKIHVTSTYFFWCNFDGRKIHVVSRYFFRCNFNGWKLHLVFAYFFRQNLDEFDVVFGKL